jgi:hypothetical protein
VDKEVMINMDEEYSDDFIAHEVAAGILSVVYLSHREGPTSGWDHHTRQMHYRFFPWSKQHLTIRLPYFGPGKEWLEEVNINYRPAT